MFNLYDVDVVLRLKNSFSISSLLCVDMPRFEKIPNHDDYI